MRHALPLVATVIAISSAWSAEPAATPAQKPPRPVNWRPLLPDTAPTPAAEAAFPASIKPSPVVGTENEPVVAVADGDPNHFIPFNGIALEPRVIATADDTTTLGLAWNLDFSLLHNRVAALIRGLPESDGTRTVTKDQVDLDVQVRGFGQVTAAPDLNPADHQSGRLSASAGYGWVGEHAAANQFSDAASSLYLDLSLQAGLESNQRVTSHEWVAGIHLTITPSLNAGSADYNIFDWLPRLGRFLSGDTWAGNGSGQALPIVTLGIDHVDADSNTARQSVAPDDGTFNRVYLQVSGRAPVWHLPGSDDYIFVTLSGELYQEISAPTAVNDSSLDSYVAFHCGIELPGNLTISYNRGELPMDPGTVTYWTAGWTLTL